MVYLKKFNGSDDEDEELFEKFLQHKILVTPDDQKMILFKYHSALGSIRFRLIDFSDLKSWKCLPTGRNNLFITSLSFSDDGSKLHVLYKRSFNDDFKLATFDYEEYMNRPSDSSDEAEIDDVNDEFDSPDFDELLNYSPNSNDKPMILISNKPVSMPKE